MKCRLHNLVTVASAMLLAAFAAFGSGCATHKTDWNARIGNYTYDQAVIEYGPPDKYAKLDDGTLVAEWLTHRGYNRVYVSPGYYSYYGPCYSPLFPTVMDTSSPDYYLRLIFGPDGKLRTWRSFAK